MLTILVLVDVSRADGDSKLRITQVESNLPNLKLFVELENVNLDNSKLKKNLNIKINDTPVQITDIQSVKNGNKVAENTAYLVLVDTSASMQNSISEVQSILEELYGFVSSEDKMAVFSVSNKLQQGKDFMSNDSSDQVSRNLQNALSLDATAGTYLYSGIREAYDRGRAAPDIPSRRIIILITDGGVEGDCLSCDDLKSYLDVDRLPVYSLILSQQATVDEDFKNAADQIGERTGGQSFVSMSGNKLFAQFKASQEKSSILMLRCDNFKPLNLQANLTVSLPGSQGEIEQTVKFTATPAAENTTELNNQQNLRTSYYGVMVILIPMILSLFIILAIGWVLMTKDEQPL
ncbi:vWA domain-containing protein [Desulfosporosinus hippei]|uniref:von Willebrand factor type A domain-containing protein n=1 Tax=Desulfosporosinus hippei DSM 8344 TaxID=1121419 RepID=A0A1G8CRT4_9FIRM|nr:vWA domain-containing protein [Desulfosporosinus hippei]SDH48132.1 von Willebrand factor type A domain-containing protein [Desulfosporosinus hippei DSM 8344]